MEKRGEGKCVCANIFVVVVAVVVLCFVYAEIAAKACLIDKDLSRSSRLSLIRPSPCCLY